MHYQLLFDCVLCEFIATYSTNQKNHESQAQHCTVIDDLDDEFN